MLTMPKSRFDLPPLALAGKGSLGSRIAYFRKGRGLTQTELAEKIGIIQSLVSDYESGRRRLHAEMVVRVAQALRVSTDELLGLKKPAQEPAAIRNRRLRRSVQEIEKLPRGDQEALLRTIEAFLSKAG